jgi:hypothetical protein
LAASSVSFCVIVLLARRTDLAAARLEAVDADHRQALVLPAPTAVCPRVDQERTRIYKIDRSGLWQMIPGEAGERDLVNKAMQDAQWLIIDQARSRTQEVITRFFQALGWQVETRWLDQRAATPATVESTPGG